MWESRRGKSRMPGRSAAGRRRKRIAVFRASNAARFALFIRVCGVSFAADGLFRPSGSLCYRHTFATQSCETEHSLPLFKVACGTPLRWHPAKRGVVGSPGSFSRCRCVSGRIAECPGGAGSEIMCAKGRDFPLRSPGRCPQFRRGRFGAQCTLLKKRRV